MVDETRVKDFRSVQGDGSRYTVEITDDEHIALGPVKDIYLSHEHYIVFTDPANFLWYANDSTLDDVGEQFNSIWNQVQSVKSMPMDNARGVQTYVYSSLATAIGCAFEGDVKTALDAIEQGKSTLIDASARQAKSWYMPAAAITGLCVFTIGLFFFTRVLAAPDSSTFEIFRILATGITGGSIGAMLSALGPRSGRQTFDPFATKHAARIDGALRIVYGVITAFVVTLAVDVQFVTSAAIVNDETKVSLLLPAIAGGFLERWAVDIVRLVRPGNNNAH